MYQDYRDFLSAFHAHGVKYLIVGGFAVILHAQPRFTIDLDLLHKADAENARANHAAPLAFGAASAPMPHRFQPHVGNRLLIEPKKLATPLSDAGDESDTTFRATLLLICQRMHHQDQPS